MKKNIFYAQSGGPTAVINSSACGLIETARKNKDFFGTVYAGHNGILGALKEELIDTSMESDADIAALCHTPSSAFGSCRYKLKDIEQDRVQYERLIEVFKAHNIGYFFYNGGGDSQDTAYKVSQIGEKMAYPVTCIGIPKTIDNDLPFTDNSPGFGSVAKYVAISTQEAALDVRAMAATSTKVFVLEVMGRHTGWIAAAAGLNSNSAVNGPHAILFPEVTFDPEKFLKRVDAAVKTCGFCVIVASEGIRNAAGEFLAESAAMTDAFGHKQLGGVAPVIANLIKDKLGYKYHWALADYLQRAARHIASKTDVEQAYALGKAAIEFAKQGKNNVMLTIKRQNELEYQWTIGSVALEKVANVEVTMPKEFIDESGFDITQACKDYMLPLIQGEAYPPYQQGLPQYVTLKKLMLKKKLNKHDNYLTV